MAGAAHRLTRSSYSPLIAGSLCLAFGALTLVLPSAPSYDPWSWIVWGREVVGLDLNTATGPSWKPLPVLFTTPFSLFGDAAPALWLVVARAGALGAVLVAARLGFRLAGRWGAVIGGGLLLLSPWLWGTVWTGTSEGLLLLSVLAAFDRHLAGRHGQAFALGVAAGLLRPEAWPFLGLYAVWLVVSDWRRLGWVAAGLALLPVLWLLPELWGSGSLGRAAERAQQPGPDAPAQAARPALAVIKNAILITPAVVRIGLVAGVVMLLLRRVPKGSLLPAVWLSAIGVAWVLLVAVMAELGFSGINRYLVAPIGIAHVVAALGLGWALGALSRLRARPAVRTAAAGALCVLVAAGVVRTALVDGPRTVDNATYEASVTDDLALAVAAAGGEDTLERCGPLYASFLLTPAVAWEFERHLEEVSAFARAPGVVMRAQLFPARPADPPAGVLDTAPNRELLARTEHWEVEGACAG